VKEAGPMVTIRSVRDGKERRREVFEPVEWPPKRRERDPEPERREPTREPARRKREKAPA
jgi:hypothetical protein